MSAKNSFFSWLSGRMLTRVTADVASILLNAVSAAIVSHFVYANQVINSLYCVLILSLDVSLHIWMQDGLARWSNGQLLETGGRSKVHKRLITVEWWALVIASHTIQTNGLTILGCLLSPIVFRKCATRLSCVYHQLLDKGRTTVSHSKNLVCQYPPKIRNL